MRKTCAICMSAYFLHGSTTGETSGGHLLGGPQIVRCDQAGKFLNQVDPPTTRDAPTHQPLLNSVGAQFENLGDRGGAVQIVDDGADGSSHAQHISRTKPQGASPFLARLNFFRLTCKA